MDHLHKPMTVHSSLEANTSFRLNLLVGALCSLFLLRCVNFAVENVKLNHRPLFNEPMI